MKQLAIAALICSGFLAACDEDEENSRLALRSFQEITRDEAVAMMEHVRHPDAICSNAAATVDLSDFKMIANQRGVTSAKILRANFLPTDSRQELQNKPTIIIAVDVKGQQLFFKPTNVCPPPDGSTCMDGVSAVQNDH